MDIGPCNLGGLTLSKAVSRGLNRVVRILFLTLPSLVGSVITGSLNSASLELRIPKKRALLPSSFHIPNSGKPLAYAHP